MKPNWRKINRVVHRDLGYFFTGMVIIYALSGIALNHLGDWNPSYVVNIRETKVTVPSNNIDKNDNQIIQNILQEENIELDYQNHYFPDNKTLKIFLEQGSSVVVDLKTGESIIETIQKRPVFYEINFLHYNPGKLWLWFSDAFAVSLILLALTGLFILKGRNGFKKRGLLLGSAGLLITLALLVVYI
jgi:hypothetical protein